MGIGLCSTKGEAPQIVLNIKDKYILVETLTGRILPGVSFFFFPVFVNLREEGFNSFSLVFSSTGLSTLIMDEITKKEVSPKQKDQKY